MDMGIRVMPAGESHETSNGKPDLELRRGVLVLAVLSQLRTAQYGYSLRQALAGAGMPIEEGTLYPLLRRLESQGLLVSEWRIEDGPPRRYYTLCELIGVRNDGESPDFQQEIGFKAMRD